MNTKYKYILIIVLKSSNNKAQVIKKGFYEEEKYEFNKIVTNISKADKKDTIIIERGNKAFYITKENILYVETINIDE